VYLGVEGDSEHVLEALEPVSAVAQHRADLGIGKMGELDLHGRAVHGVGVFDRVERGMVRDPAEPEADDLGEWGVGPCEGRGATSNRQDEPGRAGAGLRSPARGDDQLCLGGLDARRQRASQNSDDRWPTAFLPVFLGALRSAACSADSHGWPDCRARRGVTAHRAHVSRRWALARGVCSVPKRVTHARDSR
jgi:hypothetical protein